MLFSEKDLKEKKVDNGFDENVNTATFNDLNGNNELNIDLDSPNSAWSISKERTKQRINNLASSNGSQERFKRAFTNYMLPQDTPERRRRVYATSPQALEDAVGDYYNTELKKIDKMILIFYILKCNLTVLNILHSTKVYKKLD